LPIEGLCSVLAGQPDERGPHPEIPFFLLKKSSIKRALVLLSIAVEKLPTNSGGGIVADSSDLSWRSSRLNFIYQKRPRK
jgi:hypothetical protein